MSISPSRPLGTARDREVRRLRIMALVKGGLSYENIARSEKLSRERVRQIVVRSLEAERDGLRTDMRLLNAARLEPAMQLAARRIAEGRLDAINPLIKLIDRMEKYTPPKSPYDQSARARLLAKLNLANDRLQDEEDRKNAATSPPTS
jgi:hypothetical protein